MPGSKLVPVQVPPLLLAQEGVTKSVVMRTLSVLFGVSDVFVIVMLTAVLGSLGLVPKSWPTVTVGGNVGTEPPPIPAIAGVTPRRRIPTSPATPSAIPSRPASRTLHIARSSLVGPIVCAE
jgi:hypothetical protein